MGMMNREEALREVAKWTAWPEPGRYPTYKTPDEWDWVIQFGENVLVHSIHDPIKIGDWAESKGVLIVSTPTAEPNKYQRTVPSTTIDVYDVLHAYSVTNPATQHAVKKLLQPGNRGHKDTLTDLREALASIQRAIQIEEQSCQP
jgi:hypothetical protein